MEYNKIISVTGMIGLFELIGSKSDGAIVRSLEDNTTKFASSRSHQFSHLESIEIFTVRDNVNLVEILKAMKESSAKLPDYKDAAAVKKYFEKVFPDIDFDRVYASDMKKMVRWFAILETNKIDFSIKKEEEVATEKKETSDAKIEPETKKAAPKKAAKKKAEAKPETKESPKKKATTKQKKAEK